MQIFRSQKGKGTTVITNWIFFALTVFVVLLFLLNEVKNCDSPNFCATSIFFHVFTGSFFSLIILAIFSQKHRQRLADSGVILFFLQGITIGKMFWIPIGYIAVLGVSYISSFSDWEYAPHSAIFISGLIMLVAFFETKAITIPILIHGFYNSTAVLLRSQGLSQFPIQVPDIGVSYQLFGDTLSEVFFQIILVASSEEMFKVFVMAFFIVSTEGNFTSKGMVKYAGGVFAVFIWTIYHTILAL